MGELFLVYFLLLSPSSSRIPLTIIQTAPAAHPRPPAGVLYAALNKHTSHPTYRTSSIEIYEGVFGIISRSSRSSYIKEKIHPWMNNPSLKRKKKFFLDVRPRRPFFISRPCFSLYRGAQQNSPVNAIVRRSRGTSCSTRAVVVISAGDPLTPPYCLVVLVRLLETNGGVVLLPVSAPIIFQIA